MSCHGAQNAPTRTCSCSHYGCHYCYARATHPYLGLDADEDFEKKIVVKTNMAEVLRGELRKASWTRERVAIGTATDAYQPCEGRYRLTRHCLDALLDANTPISIVTKSTLILPGITDSVESLEAVAAAAKDHGAVSFGSAVLRLAPMVKEHYLGFVAEAFPDLLPRYERAYCGTNISSDYQTAIERRLARTRERHGFAEDAMHNRTDNAGGGMPIPA